MPTLKDIFNNLKQGIVGTKTSKLDKQIDTSLNVLNSYDSTKTRNVYHDVLQNIVQATGEPENEDFIKDLNKIGGVETLGQGERIGRYEQYDQIIRKIPYCKRALKVLTDNIMAPDDITKRSLQVVNEKEDKIKSDQEKNAVSRIKQIINNIHFEQYTDQLVSSTLKKGDYFIEIIHSPKGKNAMSVLTEGKVNELDKNIYSESDPINFKIKLENKELKEEKSVSGNIYLCEYNPFGGTLFNKSNNQGPSAWKDASGLPITHKPFQPNPQSKDPNTAKTVNNDPYEKNLDRKNYKFKSKYNDIESDDDNENEEKTLKDIFITFHDPKYVVKLQSERFKVCLGYLVFPKVNKGMHTAGLWNATTSDVDQVCLNIIKHLQDNIESGKDKLPSTGDLKDIVSSHLKDIKEGEDLKIRYVSPEKISHWKLGSDIYDPYGESIFDSIVFDAQLLTAMKTAQTIKQLTSATDKRLVRVETGLPRDAKNVVEAIKESFRKRKISIDQFGSIDSIPSMISTFEDIYIPMRDGKNFVEIDKIDFGPDPQNDIEPIRFIRDSIVANLYVPPAFLGLEENVSNRALLNVENILFARTIIAYQREFSVLLKDLFSKVYHMIYPDGADDLDNILITFPPPKASPYEHQMEYVEQMVRLAEALEQFGVPKEYSKKKYLPDLDWDEIEKERALDKVEKELGSVDNQEEMMGGGGIPGGF